MTDLREDLARAVSTVLHGAADSYDVWEDAIGEADREKCRQIADAAVALLWPRAMEMAAKVAERFDAGMKHRDEQQRIADHTARDIATAIRSTGAPTK
jgi:hypothetical protein